MGTIGAGSATLPATYVQGFGSLSGVAVERMRAAGVPESAISVADSIVGTPHGAMATETGVLPQAGGSAIDAPQDAAATNGVPGSLDQPDQTYPALTQAHVMVFRAIGTPEAVIGSIASQNPNAGVIEQYIQSEIMQNPEGWDQYVGNPTGTARAGLQQLIPGIQLPGSAAYAGQGGTIDATGVGVTDPAVVAGNAKNDLMKTIVWGAVGLGAAIVGYRFLKGRGAAQAAAKVAAGGGAGAVDGVANIARQTLGMAAGDAGAMAGSMAASGGSVLSGGVAMADHLARGLPPGHEVASLVGNAALIYNQPFERVAMLHILDRAASTGQLPLMLGGAGQAGLLEQVGAAVRGASHLL